MSTFNCSLAEFNKGVCDFIREAGLRSNTQDGIANMHKGLVLMYLGIQDITDEQMETAATFLEIATIGAMKRGWHLVRPEGLELQS